MAGYKFHILFGVLFAGVAGYFSYNYLSFSRIDVLLFVPILFFYSILPDIDVASSKARKIVTIVGLLFLLGAIILGVKWLSISVTMVLIMLQFVKHRKFVHTIAAGLLFSLPLIVFSYLLAGFAFIGYLSHLLLDGKIRFI